ncbi:hypothetical protein Tco_1196582, partial [Tanacetum coccineum]
DAEERRYGIRDVGYGIRDTWVDPAEPVLKIAPTTVGEDAQDSRSRISQRVGRDAQRVDLLMGDLCPSATSAISTTMARAPKGHFKRDCPKLKNKDRGNRNAQGWVYAVGNAEKRGNAPGNPDANVVTGHPFNIDLMPVELGSFDVIV